MLHSRQNWIHCVANSNILVRTNDCLFSAHRPHMWFFLYVTPRCDQLLSRNGARRSTFWPWAIRCNACAFCHCHLLAVIDWRVAHLGLLHRRPQHRSRILCCYRVVASLHCWWASRFLEWRLLLCLSSQVGTLMLLILQQAKYELSSLRRFAFAICA